MDGLLIISGLLALAVTVIGWRFVHQLKRRRLVSGVLWSMQGALWFSLFVIVLLVYSNLHTYQRLTYESVIADVYVRELGPQKYQLSVSYSDAEHDQHYYVLEGDQWQLDARVLKWKGWANLIGLNSFYQLDRLSGRYADASQAKTRVPSVHDLSTRSQGLDIWKMKQLLRDKVWFVDALFGQGVFMPMVDGAHFRVLIGQSGLITRPANEVARAAAVL